LCDFQDNKVESILDSEVLTFMNFFQVQSMVLFSWCAKGKILVALPLFDKTLAPSDSVIGSD
jgi:hypothetical protein